MENDVQLVALACAHSEEIGPTEFAASFWNAVDLTANPRLRSIWSLFPALC